MGIQNGTLIGTLAYNSWIAMQGKGETAASTCAYNDLALIRIASSQVANVNPTDPFWGGPDGLAAASARRGRTGVRLWQLDPATGRERAEPQDRREPRGTRTRGGELSEQAYTVSPGIPGDSGSGFMDASGDALGVLSTVEFAPVPASNGVGTLAREVEYPTRPPAWGSGRRGDVAFQRSPIVARPVSRTPSGSYVSGIPTGAWTSAAQACRERAR